jgi:hypothetical protein
VGVDHARHERPAAAIDDLHAGRRGEIVRRERLDPPGLDDKAKAAPERAGLAVEEEEIRENDGRNRGLRLRAGRKAESGERRADARDETSPREVAVDAPRDRADFGRAAAAAAVRDRLGAVIGWRA